MHASPVSKRLTRSLASKLGRNLAQSPLKRKSVKLELSSSNLKKCIDSQDVSKVHHSNNNNNCQIKEESQKRNYVKIEYEAESKAVLLEKSEYFQNVEDEREVKQKRWEPQLWKTQYENILTMRKDYNAPVDTMGCDKISDEKAEPNVRTKTPYVIDNKYTAIESQAISNLIL